MNTRKFGSRKKIIVLIIIAASIIGVAIAAPKVIETYKESKMTFTQPVGRLVVGSNEKLKDVTTEYATARAIKNFKHYIKVSCSLTMYGYDDKYVYAMNACNSTDGSGYAAPTRFTYVNNPLRITGQTEQGDGNFNPSIQAIYPKEMYRALNHIWIQ